MAALSVSRSEEIRHPDFPSVGKQIVSRLLEELGEDPGREGLRRTPQRVWDSLSFLTDGYDRDPLDVVGDALFFEDYDEMVVVRDIEFYSLCEHHLLPFFGCVHVAYIPNGRIVGLSKLPRLVDVFTHRLQVQERLTTQIAEALEEVLEPQGVAVVIEASHLCMMMRGVQKQAARTLTSAVRGTFKNDPTVRAEFFDLVKQER
ncbi:MAG TPA: GTP cyclohydrolase I FolE [Chloroflexota bacterium]|nr:GTP cyclohydrolase I FolE [Chloroflexota bacterium]